MKFRDWVNKNVEEIEKTLEELNDKKDKLDEEVQQIKAGMDYKDMLQVFETHQDVKYMTALFEIISNTRAFTHPEAVGVYEADLRFEKEQELKKQYVAAQVKLAENMGKVALSQKDLSNNIHDLSKQVKVLNNKCSNGTATASDGEAVMAAAANCSTLVANLFQLMEIVCKV